MRAEAPGGQEPSLNGPSSRRRSLRTSLSHPLQIAAIEAPGGGVVGLTFCPDKHQSAAATGAWARNLALDLTAIRDWDAGVLVTLVTAIEMAELRVEGLGAAAEALGMAWLHLPLADASAPRPDWDAAWSAVCGRVHAELDKGGRVLVHCKGGLGRAGTVAARILIEWGMLAEDAIHAVRQARPGAIETVGQESYLRALRSPVQGQRGVAAAPLQPPAASAPTASVGPLSADPGRTTRLDWFERLTGFREGGYDQTRAQLEVDGRTLRSRVNDPAGQSLLLLLNRLASTMARSLALHGRRCPTVHLCQYCGSP